MQSREDDEEDARNPAEADTVTRRRFLAAFAILSAAYVFGAWVAHDPDFDVTFGLEAWRRFGPVAAAVTTVALAVLLAGRRVASSIASAAEATVRAIPRWARLPA